MMRTTEKELTVLEKHEVRTGWREQARWRRNNRRWLRYSGYIALAVQKKLEELSLSQKELAERVSCSPQYISKLLKGSENLTLETISKLEEALDLDLVRTAFSSIEDYALKEDHIHCVAEPKRSSGPRIEAE